MEVAFIKLEEPLGRLVSEEDFHGLLAEAAKPFDVTVCLDLNAY